MLKRIVFTLVFFVSVPLFPYVQSVFYLMQMETDNITNLKTYSDFTNILKEEFAARHYYLLDGMNPGPEREEPNYMISGRISYQGDRFLITLQTENITNHKDRWEDSVYTSDLRGSAGFREAAKALAVRAELFRRNKPPKIYREKTDYERLYGRVMDGKFNRKLDHIELLNIFNVGAVFPTGYDVGLPFRISLDFFEYAYVWIIEGTRFGGGGGAKVFSYHNPTAMTFLPVVTYVPIFIFPDDYEYNRMDLYFSAEAGFFIPQYSYIDLSLRLQFNGVAVTAGFLYQPYYASETFLRNESWTVYGGLVFSFGKYTAKWR